MSALGLALSLTAAGVVGVAGVVTTQSLSGSRQAETSRAEEERKEITLETPNVREVSEQEEKVEAEELAGRATEDQLIGWNMYPKVRRIFKDHPLAGQWTCRNNFDYFQINPSTRITVDEKYRDYFMDAVSKECKKQEQGNRSR